MVKYLILYYFCYDYAFVLNHVYDFFYIITTIIRILAIRYFT